MISRICRCLRWGFVACAVGALGVVAVPVSNAHADVISLGACNSSALSQPFEQWGDFSSYELAPGGDFESSGLVSSPWTLNGGAELVSGSEPFAATGELGASSLSLPAGASAQSPPTCMNAAYPSVRFFIAGSGTVLVEVVEGTSSSPSVLPLAQASGCRPP
jgi:hypothetical protein